MPCEIIERRNGQLTARISGTLKKAELDEIQKAVIEEIKSGCKVRLLWIINNFEGWDNRDDWGDVSFQSQYDPCIEKIAVVCEQSWQEKAEAFVGKGIRSVDIRCFLPSELALARAWIK